MVFPWIVLFVQQLFSDVQVGGGTAKVSDGAGFDGCFVVLFRCSVKMTWLPQSPFDLGT